MTQAFADSRRTCESIRQRNRRVMIRLIGTQTRMLQTTQIIHSSADRLLRCELARGTRPASALYRMLVDPRP